MSTMSTTFFALGYTIRLKNYKLQKLFMQKRITQKEQPVNCTENC